MIDKVQLQDFKGFNRDRSALRKVPVYNSKTDFSPKTDIFTKAKDIIVKNPKKIAIGAAVLTGITVGAILLATKGKPLLINLEGKKLQSKGNKILRQANTIIENAQKEYDSALALIQEGKLTDFADKSDEAGNVIRKFIPNNNKMLMQEISKGKTINEVQFDPNDLTIFEILKDIKSDSEKRLKIGQTFVYDKNRILSDFYEKVDLVKGKTKNYFHFKNGELSVFSKNSKMTNETVSTKEEYTFFRRKLRKYYKDMTVDNTTSETKKTFYFSDNGKVEEYKRKSLLAYDPKTQEVKETIKEHFVLDNDGKLKKEK